SRRRRGTPRPWTQRARRTRSQSRSSPCLGAGGARGQLPSVLRGSSSTVVVLASSASHRPPWGWAWGWGLDFRTFWDVSQGEHNAPAEQVFVFKDVERLVRDSRQLK